eukprot:gene21574-33191_t
MDKVNVHEVAAEVGFHAVYVCRAGGTGSTWDPLRRMSQIVDGAEFFFCTAYYPPRDRNRPELFSLGKPRESHAMKAYRKLLEKSEHRDALLESWERVDETGPKETDPLAPTKRQPPEARAVELQKVLDETPLISPRLLSSLDVDNAMQHYFGVDRLQAESTDRLAQQAKTVLRRWLRHRDVLIETQATADLAEFLTEFDVELERVERKLSRLLDRERAGYLDEARKTSLLNYAAYLHSGRTEVGEYLAEAVE